MDEPRRSTLEALDPAQQGGLSEAQRDAIARAVIAQGPALMREAKSRRVLRAAAVGGALAAAAALLIVLDGREGEPRSSSVSVATTPALACAADRAVMPVRTEASDRLTLQVGTRARAVATPNSHLSVIEAVPCSTHLALTEGTLTLDAYDLGGGALRVDTPHGQVQVQGTLFRVVTAASSTIVSVADGEVVVKRFSQANEVVGAGQSLTVTPDGLERAGLSSEEQRALRRAFDEPSEATQAATESDSASESERAAVPSRAARLAKHAPHVAERAAPRPTASELLAQAETLWRNGERQAARQAFIAAAEDPGAAGEAAWVRLARLELNEGSAKGALLALEARKKRSGKGVLGAEALWLEIQSYQRSGRDAEARRAASALIRDYPSAPQADAARKLANGAGAP